MDDHGNEVLNLGSFALLPLHVVRLILMRDELKADEFSKFQVEIFQRHELYISLSRLHFSGVRSTLIILDSLSKK